LSYRGILNNDDIIPTTSDLVKIKSVQIGPSSGAKGASVTKCASGPRTPDFSSVWTRVRNQPVAHRHSKAGGSLTGAACEDVDGCDYPTETLIFLVVGFTLGRCKRSTPSLTVASI